MIDDYDDHYDGEGDDDDDDDDDVDDDDVDVDILVSPLRQSQRTRSQKTSPQHAAGNSEHRGTAGAAHSTRAAKNAVVVPRQSQRKRASNSKTRPQNDTPSAATTQPSPAPADSTLPTAATNRFLDTDSLTKVGCLFASASSPHKFRTFTDVDSC